MLWLTSQQWYSSCQVYSYNFTEIVRDIPMIFQKLSRKIPMILQIFSKKIPMILQKLSGKFLWFYRNCQCYPYAFTEIVKDIFLWFNSDCQCNSHVFTQLSSQVPVYQNDFSHNSQCNCILSICFYSHYYTYPYDFTAKLGRTYMSPIMHF